MTLGTCLRTGPARLPVLLAVLGFAGFSSPAKVTAQGLTFTASPSARWIDWDDELGFRQTNLLGGSVGMGFGRFVGLHAFYLEDQGSRLFEESDGSSAFPTFDLVQFGAQFSLAIGSGTFVPVLVGGGSVLEFAPEDGERVRKLSLDYGAGFRAVLGGNLRGEILVERTQFRLDPLSLTSPGDPEPEGRNPLRRNLALSASLGLLVGNRPFERATELDQALENRYRAPLAGLALAVEPLVGRLDYDKALGQEDQDMIGVRAGVDFGSFFGLRGFHWWGTESDFRSTTDFRAWGGEAQFTFSGAGSLSPYLTAGAGELSWGEGDEGRPTPADQTALIVGGGADFDLGSRVRATVAVRDYVLAGSDLSVSGDLQDLSDPDDLIHNWQFTAGLRFLVGGNRERPAAGREKGSPAGQGQPRVASQPTAEERAAGTRPTPTEAPAPAVAPRPAVSPRDTVVQVDTVLRVDTVDMTGMAGGRTIVLPVLDQGEIYLRFGAPSGSPILTRAVSGTDTTGVGVGEETTRVFTEADLRRLIREELAGRPPAQVAQEPVGLREMEARLMQRMAEIEAVAREAEAAAGTAPETVTPRPAARAPTTDRRVEELRPYSGLNVTTDVQLLVGLGADIGALNPGSRFRLVPRFSLGFGQGNTSYLVAGEVEYRFPEVDAGRRVTFEPLVSAGPGLLKRGDMELQLGTFLGSGLRLYQADGSPGLHLIAGFQGLDFFDQTRLIVGLRQFR